MSLIDIEGVPRRTMTLFFLIDKSSSMQGSKIDAVNDAVREVLPIIDEISVTNPDAEIKVASLEFSNGVNWLYDEPRPTTDFTWLDVQASGCTALGRACSELNSKLSRNGFMKSASGSYAPAIILLSDGAPTDNFQSGLAELKNNNWFKSAIKVAIAIGDDADQNVLAEFTGTPEAVFTAHNVNALKNLIRIVAITSSQIGSQSSSANSTTKEQEVLRTIKNDPTVCADPSDMSSAPWENW